jgi:hypothetical protein
MRPLPRLLLTCSIALLGASTLHAQETKVTCKDGTKSKAGQGACAKHGGIAPAGETKAEMKAVKKEEQKEMKAEEKTETKAVKKEEKAKEEEKVAAGATAECKDHTYSHTKSHKGACSGHGGVLKWMEPKK